MDKIEVVAIKDGVLLYNTDNTLDLSDSFDILTYDGSFIPGLENIPNQVIKNMIGISHSLQELNLTSGILGLDIICLKSISGNIEPILEWMTNNNYLVREEGKISYSPEFNNILPPLDRIRSLPYTRVRVWSPSERSLNLMNIKRYTIL